MRKNNYIDPRQLTFSFEVMADHIETLKNENNFDIDEADNGNRQTNSSPRNSNGRVKNRNYKKDSSRTRITQFSLFDTGSVGIEQPRQTEMAGTKGNDGIDSNSFPATGDGNESLDQRFSMGDEAIRLDGLRDIAETWDQNRIVENFKINPEVNLGFGNVTVKFADNIKALELLNSLELEKNKEATLEEQQVLVRYVGWGGMPQAFDAKNEQWRDKYEQLRLLLDDEAYTKARRSTQDAHYTSETVIQGIYTGLNKLGVSPNNNEPLSILEPSAGTGHFIGLLPTDIKAEFVAIEQDATTSKIAKYLYPTSKHINNGFQNILLPNDSFDLVVGNPPFGQQSLFDDNHLDISKFSIHNYFLSKSILKLREGGIGAFVVSRYFMDSVDSKAREYIAKEANFLGAIRLPQTAFKENALTQVTTDIVFFQKNSKELNNNEWLNSEITTVYNDVDGIEDEAHINSYFINNPAQIIGELVYESSQFGKSLTCVASKDIDFKVEINERIACLPNDIFIPRQKAIELLPTFAIDKDFIETTYFQNLKQGAFCIEPKTNIIIYKCLGDFGVDSYKAVPIKRESERARTIKMIAIRDNLRTLINLEKSDASTDLIESTRHKLNYIYDDFTKQFGFLNSQFNRSLMREDPECALIESLEVAYDKGISDELAHKQNKKPRPASAKKATIFSQRVLNPEKQILRAESSKDALIISLRETGKVNFERMGQLTGMPHELIREELQAQNFIFRNPETTDWEIRDKYLTGNVREKLAIAEQHAQKDAQYFINVKALHEAMPPEIEAVDIGIKFGSTWVPGEVFSQFIEEVIHEGSGRQTIQYVPSLCRWKANIVIYNETINDSTWGTPEISAAEIMEALLKNSPLKVMKETGALNEDGKPILTLDQELTAAVIQKADTIKQAFKDWVWIDDARRESLSKIYNERFNTNVPPRYDGSDLSLINASTQVNLRPHQKNVIWRSIQEGTALFDHRVGAGKTLACIATVMESRRMGFMKKPMIVVPNHLIYAWRDEFFKLYPDASLLVAEKKDFTKQNRERFFSRIATGDWDAVILAHSSFKKIDMPHETQEEILKEQMDMVMLAIANAKEGEDRVTVKMLEKQKEAVTNRYKELVHKMGKKDTSVDFSDLGVDALFVDESQEFKNLGFATSMNVSGLGNTIGSAKALDLFIKCRYLQKKNNNRGVYFLTGTPISNSIAEVYTVQRYLQYNELEKKGIEYFDSWASTFGQITNGWELDSTGVNYKLKSRFAKFQNVPELLAMYRTVADVVTQGDLDEQCRKAGLKPLAPAIKSGAPINIIAERSQNQAEYMDNIIYRMEHLPKDPSKDNPLKITNDARKAGLDFRMIDPASEDFAGSKINIAVERIYEIWKNTKEDKGTQLVFCDLSTPKKQSDASISHLEKKINDSDLIPLAEDADNEQIIDMDELVSLTSKFSVYNDMQKKLLNKGIPQGEIAFIHDANTDIRKAKLFSDVQNGDVRVLFGSTSKMGAGMNVQKRLIAAHHLDAPWRPSDVEQRNGRIIRQGNMFYERDPDFQVEINYYATKQMYDARMWQTIEYKAVAIEQFRKGDLAQRAIEDTTSDAASAADMKAAASGNPFILTQVQLSSELKKLEALFIQHNREQYRLQDRLKKLGGAGERFQKSKSLYEANIKCRNANTRSSLQGIYIDGKFLDKEDKDNKAMLLQKFSNHISEVAKAAQGQEYLVGTYRGFETTIQRRHEHNFCFVIKGANDQKFYPENLQYEFIGKFSLQGLFQRLDNFLDKGLEQNFQNAQNSYKSELEQIDNVKANLDKEFPQKSELLLCRANNLAVIRELQKMGDDPGYVSTWTPATTLTLATAEKNNTDENINTLEQAIKALDIQDFKGNASDEDLKLITDKFKTAIKNKDVDTILSLETICQEIDLKLFIPIEKTTDIEKHTQCKDVLYNIKKLWDKTKDQDAIKRQYAKEIANNTTATASMANNQSFNEISPLIKSYRTSLRNTLEGVAGTAQKNFHFKRLDAMEAVKNEYVLQRGKALGIGKAIDKGLGR